MTILHLTTFLQGGAGRAITDLACAQHAAGHDVVVVTSDRGEGSYGNYPEYLERLRSSGVRLLAVDSLFKRDIALNLRVVEALRRTVDVRTLDIIHAHAARPALIGRMFLDGTSTGSGLPNPEPRTPIPVVQTQHGWGTSKTPEQAAADVQTLQDVDRVIATSSATRDLLAAMDVPAASISVIPCGLSSACPGDAPPAARERLQPRRAAGSRLVGCIGSVTANKNQRLLIDALPALADLDVVAVFIGEGSEALAAYAREAGVGDRVVACGYQPAASQWLPLLDLLAVPSQTEGQGLVVLEAFRAGVPVVASDIPALAELVDHARTGFLFTPNDAAALGRALRAAYALGTYDRSVLVQAARARFTADFTIERMVTAHSEVYAAVRGH